MQEMKPQTDVLDHLPKLKAMALSDRAVFEKGMKAFVSYVQAYAKHECNLIFRVKGNSQQGLPVFGCGKNTVFLSTSFSYWFLISNLLSVASDSHRTVFSSNLFLAIFKRKHFVSEFDQTDMNICKSEFALSLVLNTECKQYSKTTFVT